MSNVIKSQGSVSWLIAKREDGKHSWTVWADEDHIGNNDELDSGGVCDTFTEAMAAVLPTIAKLVVMSALSRETER